jgi:DNA replication protein DnaC
MSRRFPQGYEQSTWDQVPQCETVRDWICRAGREKRWPIFIHGGTGCGKTSLAALLNHSASSPLWRRADEFLLTLATGRIDATYRAEFEKVKYCSCLFLDDLGLRSSTEAMNQILFDILEVRKGKALVITSNHSPEDLSEMKNAKGDEAGYDGRILSRLLAGTVIYISAGDRRDRRGRRHLADDPDRDWNI